MRATGPTPAVRRAVHERDGDRCVCCGRSGDLQVHHRRPRAMGGTVLLDTNGQANLILLCASCHAKVESERDWAREHGLLVRQYATPADVPLTWHGVRVRLHDDGTVQHQAVKETPGARGVPAEASYAELRARNLLAQSLLNQRTTPEGLSVADVAVVLDTLRGAFDVEVSA